MIIHRYIVQEIAKPLLVGSVLLAIVFASYRSAVNLTDAASGMVLPDVALKLIVLETLVALEVLLPTALYLSVVVGLSRLYNDSEMTALQATGIGEKKILGSVFRFSVVIALLVAVLSIFVRPWAYQTSYILEAEGVARTDITSLDAERFYPLGNSNSVLFAEHVNPQQHRMKQVFVQNSFGTSNMIIYAQEAFRPRSNPEARRSMVLLDGHAYEIDRAESNDRLIKFESLTLHLEEENTIDVNQSRRAESTLDLSRSSRPKDIAEFQWRISTPVATILLALLAVPLSRKSPRQGKNSGIVLAALVYALFFNVTGVAKTWVEQGVVGKMPGLWWAYAIPALLLLFLFWKPRRL